MKTVGIIVEYNPFHNGHLYHLQQAKKESGADIVIAVMSGYFLQRGEPSLLTKWTRAEMALSAGADLVFELPYAFSTQKAELFASGAVSILDAVGTDTICFGSEAGQIEPFYELVDFMKNNETAFNQELKKQIKKGVSYPRAASEAFRHLKRSELLDLSQPNNILGFHYVKAIHEQRSGMKVMTIQRKKAGYHDPTPASETIASATSIRNEIAKKQSLDAIKHFVPESSYRLLKRETGEYGKLVSWEDYFPFLKYRIVSSRVEEMRSIYEMEEGIENRLIHYIKEAETFQSFLEKIKTKRYTWTRLQRICTHLLTNVKKEEMALTLSLRKATYLRLLAMSTNGQQYLNETKKQFGLPLVATRSKHHDPLLSLDERAANCYAMAYPSPIRETLLRREFALPPIHQSTRVF